MDLLTALGAALAAAHFGTPLAYYAAARRWLKMPWRIKPDPAYPPRSQPPTTSRNAEEQEGLHRGHS
jgi:hypothetical protein